MDDKIREILENCQPTDYNFDEFDYNQAIAKIKKAIEEYYEPKKM